MDLVDGRRFLALMRRYCIDYVNCHDQDVTRDLMVDDYALRMGEHRVVGRDTAYRDATRQQIGQYPGLLLTVHEIATNGDRLMMRFSEHGRRVKDGRECGWGGIGLYRWNGDRLTANNVEQDYWARRRQIDTGRPDPVDHPHIAPWDVIPEAADPEAETIVRAWLDEGRLGVDPAVHCDDSWTGQEPMRAIDQDAMEINDLFSVGSMVAFHVTQSGKVSPDFGAASGAAGRLHSAGIVHVADGRVERGRVIRNRMDLMRTAETSA